MSTSHWRSSSVAIMAPPSVSTGTVSVYVPDPVRRHVSVTAVSGARNSTYSLIPPSNRKVLSRGKPPSVSEPARSSRSVSVSPGMRKAVCRALAESSSVWNEAPRVKICRSAQ
jgi:hypothetical protein